MFSPTTLIILQALGLAFLLATCLVPPALAAGKFADFYEELPEEVKRGIDRMPAMLGTFERALYALLLIFPSWIYPYQYSAAGILLALAIYRSVDGIKFYLSFLHSKAISSRIYTYCRLCALGQALKIPIIAMVLYLLLLPR